MELETVNKLYLELSQVTTATTARELALVSALRRAQRRHWPIISRRTATK